MTFKLSNILIILVVFCILLNGCAFQKKDINTHEGQVILRLAENHVKDYPTVRADRLFANLVYERTEENIKIIVYPEGKLGDEESVIEQVKFGVIDMARVSIAPLVTIDESFGVLALPYLYRDKDHMFKVLEGPLGDDFRHSLISNQMYGLAWYDAGARNFYNSIKEIRVPDDMKYLRIRVQEMDLMKDFVRNIGATPVPLVFSEVFGAIQTGIIDGAENNWPSYVSTSHNMVAKYITIGEHIRIPELVIINKITYDRLTEEQQQIIEECAKEAALYQREEMVKEEEKAREIAIENGSIITVLTAEEREQFKSRALPIYESFKSHEDIIEQITNTE
jgi:tripartite ATP-independent transporter DctP family solute receptor